MRGAAGRQRPSVKLQNHVSRLEGVWLYLLISYKYVAVAQELIVIAE